MKCTTFMALLLTAVCASAQKPIPAPGADKNINIDIHPKFKFDRQSDDAIYDQAARQLQRRDYEGAQRAYAVVAQRGGPRSEGAAYWNAYALHKLGRDQEALAALSELFSRKPDSRWTDDAKALELEIRQSQGQNVSPDAQPDEELKLMALSTLMNSDPARVVPVIQKVLAGKGSVMVKEQALFVLAQSRSSDARRILMDVAKGRGNPDLQMHAVTLLGVAGGTESAPLLAEIYRSAQDKAMKRRILQSLGVARAGEQLLTIVKSEQDPDLRASAVHGIAMTNASLPPDALRELFRNEQDRQVRRALVDVMGMRKDSKALADIVRTDKDYEFRRMALERLQNADPRAASELMIQILEK